MRSIDECLANIQRITGHAPKKSGNEWVGFCPIHEADGRGHKPSLTLRQGDKQAVLVNCHAGCDSLAILKALGVNGTPHQTASIVATYRYQDAEGHDIREKLRFEPKDFRIRHRDAATGEWVYKAGSGPAVLYRLPEIKTAIASGHTVFVVEGEKDADRLAALGLVATTNIEGAAQPNQRPKWKAAYTGQLKGAVRVVLLPDNDAPGRAHMSHIAKALWDQGIDARIIELNGLPEKGDVSDWLGAGHTAEELETLADTLQATAQDTTRKPTIQVQPGRVPWMTDDAERWLIERDDGIFQRGDCLVRWSISKQETVHGIHRPDGVAIIKHIDVEHLLDRLGRHINWVRWDQRTKADVPTNAPRSVALTLLERDGEWKFPVLVGVITTPTLRPDGSLLDKPGYDEITGLLYVERQPVPPIPTHPSREEARQALDFLANEILAGFPFLEPYHRSAALSALLSVTVRHTLRHTPLHAFTAPKAGSGKSLLANCVALLGTGRPAAVLSLSEDQGEMNKAITSLLMQGDAVVNLDNIERGEALAGREICKAITGEIYSGRILGMTKFVDLATSCLWLATGNQLQVSGDMTRRVVLCEIDPECERPDEREFTRDLHEWIPEHRPELVKAALTVLRAYVVAGRPRQPVPPLGGFEDWSNLVRSALIWLGEADPLAGRANIEEADPERSKLKALLLAWHRAFGSFPTTSKEAVYKATPRPDPEDRYQEILEAPELYEVLAEFFKDRSGNPSSRHLGEYISQNARRIEAGARFEAAGDYQRAKLWRVKIINPTEWECAKSCEVGESGESCESFSRHVRDFAVSNRKEGEIKGVLNIQTDRELTHQTHQTHRPATSGTEKAGEIGGMRNTETDRELTPQTPQTPRKPAALPVESLPPLTANERKAVAILRDLHRKHAENLKSGGLPPSGAKVTTRYLIEALREQRIPSEAAIGLKSRGLAVEENGVWQLTEHGQAVIS